MGLPSDYRDQRCSMARALEALGERWTLLIIRDGFYGVRRFGDFVEHLHVPRSVLANRLDALVAEGLMAKVLPAGRGRAEYELTAKARELWPVIHGLIAWGDKHYGQGGTPRLFVHARDGGRILTDGSCAVCGKRQEPEEVQVVPGPGLPDPGPDPDPVTVALEQAHTLLQDVRAITSSRNAP